MFFRIWCYGVMSFLPPASALVLVVGDLSVVLTMLLLKYTPCFPFGSLYVSLRKIAAALAINLRTFESSGILYISARLLRAVSNVFNRVLMPFPWISMAPKGLVRCTLSAFVVACCIFSTTSSGFIVSVKTFTICLAASRSVTVAQPRSFLRRIQWVCLWRGFEVCDNLTPRVFVSGYLPPCPSYLL